MAIGDIWRASILGDWGAGNSAVVTSHWKMLSVGADTDDIGLYLKTYLLDLLAPLQSNEFYWRQINFLSVNLTPEQSFIYTTGFPIQGARAVTSLPYQAAVVVTHRTRYAGRSYRGRWYLPAIPSDEVDNGSFLGALVTSLQTYHDDIQAAVGQGGANTDIQMGVYSKKLAHFEPISEFVVRAAVASQRRRRPGVGT